jgi:hypothetical protein
MMTKYTESRFECKGQCAPRDYECSGEYANRDEKMLDDLNMRLHTLAVQIKKNRNFAKFYNQVFPEPQFGTFSIGPFEGKIGLNFFNSFSKKPSWNEDSFLRRRTTLMLIP